MGFFSTNYCYQCRISIGGVGEGVVLPETQQLFLSLRNEAAQVAVCCEKETIGLML